jgi:hypothetical protein
LIRQVADLAAGHGLEMIDDGVDMPASETKGVRGSMIGHAWRTNSRKYACRQFALNLCAGVRFLPTSIAKLFEFVMGKLSEFWRRTDHDRATTRATMLIG